jgi:hypothetical protein
MKGTRIVSGLALVCALVLVGGFSASAALPFVEAQAEQPEVPLGTAFTYQGQLKVDDAPYTGTCDLEFSLWDALTNGTQIGSTLTKTNVGVAAGFFTLTLDFGTGRFQGDGRWLDIQVRCPAGGGSYTPLAPRQELTASPYAVYSKAAPWSGLSGVPAGFADGVDNDTTYLAGTGLILQGTTFLADSAYLQRRVSGTCTTGNAIRVVNADGTVTCQAVDANAWLLTGNAGTTPGTNFVGTTGNEALEIKVNGARALRLEPDSYSPNLIGGYSGNWLTSGVHGAVIGGGGNAGDLNRVTDNYGTVAGGFGNQAGDDAGSTDDSTKAFVGGGYMNVASGYDSVIGGGHGNLASQPRATVGGGDRNQARAHLSTIGGGTINYADGSSSTVGGGYGNGASGDKSTVPGGEEALASHYGEMAYASGEFQDTGDAQTSLYVMRRATTSDGVWENLYLDGSTVRLTLATGRTVTFDIVIAARSSDGESGGYHCWGVIERVGDATTLIGSECTNWGEDDAAWSARAQGDDANDALLVQVLGNGETIRWVAMVRTAEVSYP